MANFCTNCGKEITEGVAYCTGCGTPIAAEEAKSPQAEPEVKQESQAAQEKERPQPAYTASPQPAYQAQALPIAEKSNTVSTGYFFGMMFLYTIPVLGWLACLITALVPKNPTKRNFAKAIIIWFIVSLVLSVIGYFVFKGLFYKLLDIIKNEYGNEFEDFINTIG
jgi:hypothetical protein